MRLFVGDDWAEDHHDVEVMDGAGKVLARRRLPEGVAGIAQLHGLVGQYLAAAAPGSYLALSHSTMDQLPPRMVAAGLEMYQRAAQPLYPRTRAEVERFFAGLELVPAQPGGDPSVGFVGAWGAEDPAAADSDGSRILYCGVGRLS